MRRAALHLPLRRSERGLLYLYHGLLGAHRLLWMEMWPGVPLAVDSLGFRVQQRLELFIIIFFLILLLRSCV